PSRCFRASDIALRAELQSKNRELQGSRRQPEYLRALPPAPRKAVCRRRPGQSQNPVSAMPFRIAATCWLRECESPSPDRPHSYNHARAATQSIREEAGRLRAYWVSRRFRLLCAGIRTWACLKKNCTELVGGARKGKSNYHEGHEVARRKPPLFGVSA